MAQFGMGILQGAASKVGEHLDGLAAVRAFSEQTGKSGVFECDFDGGAGRGIADDVDLQVGAGIGDGEDVAKRGEEDGLCHGESLMMQRSRAGP